MRIIGGNLKKKKLGPVPREGIRPTADRVRESIFNILAASTRLAVVLDLFAGTGAMGIEALSRGAAKAVFIDKDPAAVLAIRKNLSACGLQSCSQVIRWDVGRGLDRLPLPVDRFTLVFLDPPYRFGLLGPALANLHSSAVLAKGARITVEHSHDEPIDTEALQADLGPVFTLIDQRRYGKTLVSFFEYVI